MSFIPSEEAKLNLGCGSNIVKGFINIDNSPSLLLASFPRFCSCLNKIGILSNGSMEAVRKFHEKREGVHYHNLKSRLPFRSGVASVIYISHMIEHLPYERASKLIGECFRILAPGGVLRIVVPDLQRRIKRYLLDLENHELFPANKFIESLQMGEKEEVSLFHRLGRLFRDGRRHRWMYDGLTLQNMMKEFGFVHAEILEFGNSRIEEIESLDLSCYRDHSVYIEGLRP